MGIIRSGAVEPAFAAITASTSASSDSTSTVIWQPSAARTRSITGVVAARRPRSSLLRAAWSMLARSARMACESPCLSRSVRIRWPIRRASGCGSVMHRASRLGRRSASGQVQPVDNSRMCGPAHGRLQSPRSQSHRDLRHCGRFSWQRYVADDIVMPLESWRCGTKCPRRRRSMGPSSTARLLAWLPALVVLDAKIYIV